MKDERTSGTIVAVPGLTLVLCLVAFAAGMFTASGLAPFLSLALLSKPNSSQAGSNMGVVKGRGPSPETKEYIKKNIVLDEMAQDERRGEELAGQKTVVVTGRIKNAGPRAIRLLEACVWFRDAKEATIWEQCDPIFVAGGDSSELKPGYLWRFFIMAKHAPVEAVLGNSEIDVTNLMFSEQEPDVRPGQTR